MSEDNTENLLMLGLELRVFYMILAALVPFLVYGISFILDPAVLFGLLISDFLDILVLGPFFAILIALVWRSYHQFKDDDFELNLPTRILGYAFIFLFFEGHAMHFTANTIDNYMRKILQVTDTTDPGLVNIIHFLDEFLGHALSFVGLFGLILTAVAIEHMHSMQPTDESNFRILTVSGAFLGILLSVSTIEASYFIEFAIVCAVLSLIWFYRVKVWSPVYRTNHPISYNVFFISIGLLVGAALYLIIFGGFIPPSEF